MDRPIEPTLPDLHIRARLFQVCVESNLKTRTTMEFRMIPSTRMQPKLPESSSTTLSSLSSPCPINWGSAVTSTFSLCSV